VFCPVYDLLVFCPYTIYCVLSCIRSTVFCPVYDLLCSALYTIYCVLSCIRSTVFGPVHDRLCSVLYTIYCVRSCTRSTVFCPVYSHISIHLFNSTIRNSTNLYLITKHLNFELRILYLRYSSIRYYLMQNIEAFCEGELKRSKQSNLSIFRNKVAFTWE